MKGGSLMRFLTWGLLCGVTSARLPARELFEERRPARAGIFDPFL